MLRKEFLTLPGATSAFRNNKKKKKNKKKKNKKKRNKKKKNKKKNKKKKKHQVLNIDILAVYLQQDHRWMCNWTW
jgi:cbb3-type cytochrome oxidase cytochrome c subunit